jgi:transposase-like protein
MATLGEKLGAKREAAILALLTARSIEDAARTAGVPPRTLHRWLQEPEFDAAYRKARRAAYGQATARLQQATSAAVSTLLKIMVDTNAPPSTRVRAADSVLDHAKQAIEIEDVEVRVAALEQAAELSKQGR